MSERKTVIVYHSSYGCETGCCGHRIEMGDDSKFSFGHCSDDEDPLQFAKSLVTETYGAEHVADLDWANCEILTYGDYPAASVPAPANNNRT